MLFRKKVQPVKPVFFDIKKKEQPMPLRRKKYGLFFAPLIILVLLLIVIHKKTEASVVSFYPETCLGGWKNPKNTTGSPALVKSDEAEKYNEQNAAIYIPGTDLYCGSFAGEVPEDTIAKTFSLSLHWAVDDGSINHKEGDTTESILETLEVKTGDSIKEPMPTPIEENQQSPTNDEKAPAGEKVSLFLHEILSASYAQAQESGKMPFFEIEYTLDGVHWSSLGQVGMLTLLTVNGDITESAGLQNFKLLKDSHFYTSRPVDFSYSFTNTGGDRVQPKGEVVVRSILGWVSGRIDANPSQGNVLPNTQRTFQVSWDSNSSIEKEKGFFRQVGYEWKHFAFGIYRATAHITYGLQQQLVKSNAIYFVVIPWHLLLVIIVPIGLLWLLSRTVIRKFKERIIQETRMNLDTQN